MGIEQRSNAGAPLVPGAGPAGAATMRVAVQHRYGSPSVLGLSEVGVLLPARGDVLVQVGAAAVHPRDCFVMTGQPYVARPAFGFRRPRHGIPGRDLAGVVAAVGKDITALRPGDEVSGWSTAGTLAEYACAPAHHLEAVPAKLSVMDAAAVPTQAPSSPTADAAAAGSAPSAGSSKRACCPGSPVSSSSPSSRSRSARTCSPWPTPSRPGRSRPSSTGPTPSTNQPTPSATSRPATPEGRSSSPSEDRTDENDPTRAYARPDLPPLRRTDRSTRKTNQ